MDGLAIDDGRCKVRTLAGNVADCGGRRRNDVFVEIGAVQDALDEGTEAAGVDNDLSELGLHTIKICC